MKYLLLFLFLFLSVCTNLRSQVTDSLQTSNEVDTTSIVTEVPDTSTQKKKGFLKRFFSDNYPSPKKAALLSFVFPGAGQAYNKKYWKIPIVYAGLGAFIYFIDFNQTEYRRFKLAHLYRVDGDPLTIDEFSEASVDADGLKRRRDLYHKRLELSYVGLVAVQLLSAIEAYTNAHLFTFTIDEDLSLYIDPSIQSTLQNQTAFGLGINLGFQNNRKKAKIIF